MPEVDLDFGGVGALPDEGVYRLNCDKAIYKQNKTKDGFIINLQMSLVDMPDDQEDFEGMKVFDNPSIKLAARWKLQEVLQAFTGDPWDEDGLKLEVECEEDCGEDDCHHQMVVPVLHEKQALGVCYHDDYNGRLSLKVRTYLQDDGNVEIGPSQAA